MSERLFGTADMARALGINTTALVNRRSRNWPSIPEPAFVHGKLDSPLWTREQVEQVIAERMAYARQVLDESGG